MKSQSATKSRLPSVQTRWGQQVQTTQVNPAVQEGWGKRNWDWQFSAGVQHEVLRSVSVDASYSRRSWGNFFVTHNRALGPQDYDEVTLTAPTDPRLPGGGGYPVNFLVRNNNSVLGVSDPYYTTTRDFGDETHYWHGVEIAVNARLNNGLLFQGGTSTGRGVNDTCDVLIGRYGRPMAPSAGTTAAVGVIDGQPDCRATEPWLTTVRGLVSYTAPKIDVLLSAIMRSQANVQPGGDVATNGASRSTSYLMSATQFLAATGRPRYCSRGSCASTCSSISRNKNVGGGGFPPPLLFVFPGMCRRAGEIAAGVTACAATTSRFPGRSRRRAPC